MARLYTCVLFNRRFDFAVSWPCQTSCGCRTAREPWRTYARTAAAPEPVAEPGKPFFRVRMDERRRRMDDCECKIGQIKTTGCLETFKINFHFLF